MGETTKVDLDELRRLAEAAGDLVCQTYRSEDQAYVAAVQPSRILALLGRLHAADVLARNAMDKASAAIVANLSLRDRAEKAEAENARLREALRPFAEAANDYDLDGDDDRQVAWAHDFTIGSLRRARALTANHPVQGD